MLEVAYLRSDFSFGLVADNSSTTTPTFYKLTAMWSSQAGSLLLWVWLLSIFAGIALAVTRHRHREVVPYATAVLAGIATFFMALLVFKVSPFVRVANPPAEGAGLNPLLRHPSMMFHPPMLYSGYVAWSIPFAFAVGALVTRKLDAEWIAPPAASPWWPGPSWGSGSCSAPAGPTPSSAGAATGDGTRWRTRR